MFAANGIKIESTGEKKSKAITDDGSPLDCKFILGAVKKILKSMAIACDEGGDRGQCVIHTNTGRWIVNVEAESEDTIETGWQHLLYGCRGPTAGPE